MVNLKIACRGVSPNMSDDIYILIEPKGTLNLVSIGKKGNAVPIYVCIYSVYILGSF